MTLRTRVALFFGLLSLVFLSAFSYLIFSRVRENALKGAETYLRELSQHEWEHLELPSHQISNSVDTPHYRNVYFQIWREDQLVYDSFPKGEKIQVKRNELDENQKKLFNTLEGRYAGRKYRVESYYDVSLIFEHLAIFRRTLILGCCAALLLLIPLGLIFTKFLLRPFTELAYQTSKLTVDNLSFRLPLPKIKDEYGMLAQNFNSLFERLEKSFMQVKNFAVNASHEMRTPLSVLISQAERAVRRPPQEVSGCLEVFQKLLQTSLQLRNIINRLFVLAEVERIDQEMPKIEIPVKETIEGVLASLQESYRNLMKTVEITPISKEETIRENRDLFVGTVSNLLENAIKYSKQQVVVRFSRDSKGAALIIEDDGPGIPEEKRAAVFEPFYRGDKKSNLHTLSHGLGLSIVRACVEAQKATIKLNTSPALGGLRVEVFYPA